MHISGKLQSIERFMLVYLQSRVAYQIPLGVVVIGNLLMPPIQEFKKYPA